MTKQMQFAHWMAKIGNIYYADDEQMERAFDRLEDMEVECL